MMGNKKARICKTKRQRGQSLLEVALLLPLLLGLVLGVIEVGRYAYMGILVDNAARAGAAWATQSVGNSTNTVGIQQAADNDYQNNSQNSAPLTVTSSVVCGCDDGTNSTNWASAAACSSTTSCPTGSQFAVVVTVTAQGTYTPLFHYPWTPSQLSVQRQAVMRASVN
jgi:Flp pilus assembly protein TadG